MNKKFKLLLSLLLFFSFNKIYAYDVFYSEWSDVKPSNIDDYLIQEEDRYLFYKETISNIEYLVKEDIHDKLVDYNDYIYSDESDLLDEKPLELEDRIINEMTDYEYFNGDEIKKAKFSFRNGINISRITALDNKKNVIDYEVDEEYSTIKDDDDNDVLVKDLIITFNSKQDINNLNITIYYSNEHDIMNFSYLDSNNIEMYTAEFDLSAKPYTIINLILDKQSFTVTKYTYIDKLYKTYEVQKDITEDYYVELEGYTKLEESKKTFYRYVTNDFVVVDGSGNIVTNDNYCVKSFCHIVFLKKIEPEEEVIEEEPPQEEIPEEEIPEVPEEVTINPKTLDNIYYYLIPLVISFILILLLQRNNIRKIFLVLSNRFKKI